MKLISTSLSTAYLVAVVALLQITACSSQHDDAKPAKAAPAVESKQASPAPHPAPPVEIRTSRETPLNATPLGLEIGFANLAGVKKTLPNVVFDEARGEFGVKWQSTGEGTGVDGITGLMLFFDPDNTLIFLSMTLPKDPKGLLGKLSGKYKVAENRIDNFMNYGNARLTKGDSVVVIESQHLSFAMDVSYTTTAFLAIINKATSDANAAKQQEQNSKF